MIYNNDVKKIDAYVGEGFADAKLTHNHFKSSKIIDERLNVIFDTYKEVTILHLSCYLGRLEIVKILLFHGVLRNVECVPMNDDNNININKIKDDFLEKICL